MDGLSEKVDAKSIQDLALIELSKNARILQRQLKIMKGMALSGTHQELVREIILTLEQEFNVYRI